MSTRRPPAAPITDLLRRTLADAIESGRLTYTDLLRDTGLKRASMMRFVGGVQSIRLDMADRLAAYFGLELRPKGKGR
jgi:plasmid maintenance system antidote protein VapI